MMASSHGKGEIDEGSGIFSGHAYTVISIHEAEDKRLMKIRNPWGNSEWRGAYSDHSSLWTESLKKECGWKDDNDGIFFMPFTDYLEYFRAT